MNIHTVKPEDTIFKIARTYSTSPMKIIENNNLENPDRLCVGEELLIINPTRTYTVRGGDTLKKIADRFSVSAEELYRNNPYLSGTDKLYSGQLITVKQDIPLNGSPAANGYYFKGCPEDRLNLALPYMTHLTVSLAKREGKGIRVLFDPKKAIERAKEEKRIVLIRIYDEEDDLNSFSKEYINTMVDLCIKYGADGICLAAYRIIKKEERGFEEFLIELKKMLLEKGLLLFCEADASEKINTPLIGADGCTVLYDKCKMKNIPTFDAGERSVFSDLSEIVEPSKIYMDLSSFAYMGDEPITVEEAKRIAFREKKEIIKDTDKGVCHYSRNVYKNGKKETATVNFESLENIKSKLDLIGELGLMGISFDIMRVPLEFLMMFISSFSKPSVF